MVSNPCEVVDDAAGNSISDCVGSALSVDRNFGWNNARSRRYGGDEIVAIAALAQLFVECLFFLEELVSGVDEGGDSNE